MTISRRQFLATVAGSAAASALPGSLRPAFGAPSGARAAAELTTLAQTLRKGRKVNDQGYHLVASGPGEPHIVRDELAKADPDRRSTRTSLLSFVHITDQHIIDVESPTRVEFLDRYANGPCEQIPFSSAHRPQEAACARIADAMLRRLRRIGVSPVTGAPLRAAICTGDNTDNMQINELDWFLALMNGGRLNPNSGNGAYQGVQASNDRSYWHPDPAVDDIYKTDHGFPARPGWLEKALAPFDAVGVGMPWYTCYGNHDGLAQGNAPVNPAIDRMGVGSTKVIGLPDTANPCDQFGNLGIPEGSTVMSVEPDPRRAYISRRDWIARHLESTGKPVGHGFTRENVERNLAYYATTVGPLRFITLDTVNPGGLDSGSIGEAQLTWLEGELTKAEEQRRLVVLFSHHGLRSLDNENEAPDPLNPEDSDLPRHRADEVMARISKFTCIIAWVNGHSHQNVIVPRETFWDIGTAAHIDWPAQARIIDVLDNRDGTLSIFTTNFDHEDTRIASFARELSGNDPQKGFSAGTGKAEDRNTELLLPHPFPGSSGRDGTGGEGVGNAGDDRNGSSDGDGVALPATGGGAGMPLAGALAVAASAGLMRVRRRDAD